MTLKNTNLWGKIRVVWGGKFLTIKLKNINSPALTDLQVLLVCQKK